MEIDLIRAGLRNIVLLVREYREQKVNEEEEAEAKHIEERLDNKESPSIYDSEFLMAIWKIKRELLEEITYHTGKIVDEFSLSETRDEPFDVDGKKVELARELLAKEEFDLLVSLLQLVIKKQHLEKEGEKERTFPKVKIRDIEPQLESFVCSASLQMA